MKVTHLNTYTEGGAAKAALRIHHALEGTGIQSRFLALYKANCNERNVFDFRSELGVFTGAKLKLKNRIAMRQSRFAFNEYGEWFSRLDSVWNVNRHPEIEDADVIHLHWISGFVDLPSFYANTHKKIVWTLHDHFPFSGGFHYPTQNEPLKFSSQINETIDRWKKISENHPIDFVFPSDHLRSLAISSGAFSGSRTHTIKNPVDTSLFTIKNKEECRKEFGISNEEKVVFFLSDHIHYYRKGFHMLEKALSFLPKNCTLLVAGKGKLPSSIGKVRILHKGPISDEEMMVRLYNSADVLVNPSLNDISSNTVIEAGCCGIPSVVFPVGGIPELVGPSTGIVSPSPDEKDLVRSLESALEMNWTKTLIREEFISRHNLEAVGKMYAEVYRNTEWQL